MSARREALLGRFRARSLDRVRQVGLSLLELEEGRGGEPLLAKVARELHTLKGDSRVVGLDGLSELAHAAETLLLGDRSGALPDRSACERLRASLEVVARVLRDEVKGEAADKALADERAALAGPAALKPWDGAAQAPAGPGPGAEGRPGDGPGPSSPASEAGARAGAAAPAERWLLVKAGRVDEICERVSDFTVEFRSLMFQLASLVHTGATAAQLRPLAEGVDRCRSKLDDTVASAWSLRLVPVEPALEEMVGHARTLAESQGKRVRVTVKSEGAEVERGVLDDLQEPLLHLVRNAVDHGLERPEARGDKGPEGNLILRARPAGPNLVLEVVDDGRGVDLAAVRAAAVSRGLFDRPAADRLSVREVLDLLFRHGFTTRSQVSEVSGRGVGLDIVRERLDALGGTAEVSTGSSQGTTFKLTVPSTITRERALVVECAGVLYGVPSTHVLEVVRLKEHPREQVAGGAAMRFRDEMLLVGGLAEALGAPREESPTWAMVLQAGTRRWALEVSRLLGEQELLRRPVDSLLAPFDQLAASATLDDGRLVLLLSVGALSRRGDRGATARAAPSAAGARKRVLVVDDSLTVCDLVRELLSDAGFEVEQAHDGQAALSLMAGWMPDLVLADVDMPVMDGFQLLAGVRQRWPHLPVVMLTTRGSAEDRRHAASLGANAYLVKSQFEESTLVDTLRRFL